MFYSFDSRAATKPCLVFTAVFFVLLMLPVCCANADPISETKVISDDLEIVVVKHPAKGGELLLWIAPSFGFRQGHNEMSQLLSKHGFEIWQVDISEALFLPHNSTSMRELDPKFVSDLIKIAHAETGKKIVLMSGSYGAIPALRGAREWQLTKPSSRYLLGAVLFSPNVYQFIPPLGTEPEYLPIAYATNIPVAIYQGDKNSNRWQLDKLAGALRSGGSSVQVEILQDVVSLFYQEERQPHIENYYQMIASNMNSLIRLFENHPYPLAAKTVAIAKAENAAGTGLDSRLKSYKGDPKPHSINLTDVTGKSYNINDYNNRITVVNFWASWCTPCVKEIPSLNKLRQVMQDKPFELISINYAEKAEVIKEFLKMVDVEFPVLIDEQGRESAKWKVIAFPSTFVIDTNGRIHYGVNAGIEWDTPEVLQMINGLFKE